MMRLLRICPLLLAIPAAAPAAAQEPAFHPPCCNEVHQDSLPVVPGVRLDTIVPGTEELAAASTVTELIRGRVAGLNVRESGGSIGAAPRLWIRGPASALLRNDPLVVVDGIRIVSDPDALSINVGGAGTSRLDDIDPNDVGEVRVLRGPAATALYGPEAAAGAIEITTRGKVNGPRLFHAWSGLGTRQDVADYPANFTRGGSTGTCTLQLQARGNCTPGVISSWSPLEQASPFRTGRSVNAGLAVRGTARNERMWYGFSGGWEDAEGVLRTSGREMRSLRGSVGLLLPMARVIVTAAHVRRDTELPFGNSHLLGRIGAGLDGTAFDDPNTRGYRNVPARDDFYHNTEAVSHTTVGGEAVWQTWLGFALGVHAGLDRAGAAETSATTRVVPGLGSFERRVDVQRMRSSVGARLTSQSLGSTVLGVERLGWTLDQEGRTNDAEPDLSRRSEQSDIGVYAAQTLPLGAFLLHGAVRRDEPSRTRQPQWSYSTGGEWALRGGMMPRGSLLRLRAAFGRTERGVEALAGDPVSACTGECAAFPRTETLEETEGGIDVGLWNGAVSLGATAYRRDTENLVGVGGVVPAFRSMGNLYNRGVEIQASARGGRPGLVQWEIEATGARNRNRVEADGDGFVPFSSVFGSANRHGSPLGSYFFRPILRYEDRDGDGIIEVCTGTSVCEVQLSAEEAFAGSALPERIGALAGTVRLGGILSLYARVDGERGARLLDLTNNARCAQRVNCQASYDPATPFADQARVVAAQQGSRTGFVYDADYVRLREVAVTLSAPRRWARRVGAAGVELTVGGRNLAIWTDYPGIDPEVSAAGPEVTAAYDFYSQPPVRTWTTRVDVRF
jgi:hypothetical protein